MKLPLLRAAALAVLATVVAATGVTLDAAPASAAPRVSFTITDRPALSGVADSTYLTEITISGSGFQSIQNGFGGIYVLFGWADQGTWKPSAGGKTGSDYRYVYDDETNPVGYQLFVSFPGSSTSYANNGGTIAADGTWSSTMKIPGPRFQAYDRSGAVTEVDCLAVQCGIMTIGAHGVVNSSNESFTPIAFQPVYTAADGRASAATTVAPNSAVAPTIIGGRPATIPTAVAADALPAAAGVSAEVGETRVTLTVPGADPEAWLGIYFYSDPLFAGWFKPSSTGLIDVNIPANLPYGDHRAVVYNTAGAAVGWASFELEEPDAATAPAAETPEVVAAATAPSLLPIVIAVGILALAAIAFLAFALIRRRRTQTPTV